jgi:type IV secretory pathway TrbL component
LASSGKHAAHSSALVTKGYTSVSEALKKVIALLYSQRRAHSCIGGLLLLLLVVVVEVVEVMLLAVLLSLLLLLALLMLVVVLWLWILCLSC